MGKFHELMSSPDAKPVRSDSVAGILDSFLQWTAENRAEKTMKGYRDFCQSFLDKHPDLSVQVLKPYHIQEWLTERTSWNQTTKRGAITCMKRAMKWAVKFGYIDSSPISEMEKPEALTRTKTITPEEFDTLLKAIPKADTFRELLILSWDLGARPQEIKGLESRHVDLTQQVCILPTEEEKKKRAPRVIYIPTERALEILKKRCKQYPTGPILRNRLGNGWTASAVKTRFANLEEKLGRRYRQYDFRHTWISKKLVAGVDSHVVAKLAGHSDTKMLDKIYSHVADDYAFMLEQAKKGA
jgi:integrase